MTLAASSCWFSSEISVPLASSVFAGAASFSLVHQPCSQDAADQGEHRIKYYEPDRRICNGWPMRCERDLWLHIRSSAQPELIKNAQDRERQSGKHKDDSFKAIVPHDRCVVYDFRIATKELIAPAVNENGGAH